MSEVKLVGYSSDDLMTERVFKNGQSTNKMLFGRHIKTKAQRLQEKRDKIFSKQEPLELDEWFVYLVDGEKWYYKVAQDLNILKMHHEAQFLGIGRPNQPIHKENPHKEIVNKKVDIKENKSYKIKKCCYCEVELTPRIGLAVSSTDRTRDHIIPKHKGGKIIKDCCFGCNQEKGGLMLHSYIQLLCLNQAEMKPGSEEYLLTQTKIVNANKIAIEINKG